MGRLKSKVDSVRKIKQQSDSLISFTGTNKAIIQRVILTLFFYLVSTLYAAVYATALTIDCGRSITGSISVAGEKDT